MLNNNNYFNKIVGLNLESEFVAVALPGKKYINIIEEKVKNYIKEEMFNIILSFIWYFLKTTFIECGLYEYCFPLILLAFSLRTNSILMT